MHFKGPNFAKNRSCTIFSIFIKQQFIGLVCSLFTIPDCQSDIVTNILFEMLNTKMLISNNSTDIHFFLYKIHYCSV